MLLQRSEEARQSKVTLSLRILWQKTCLKPLGFPPHSIFSPRQQQFIVSVEHGLPFCRLLQQFSSSFRDWRKCCPMWKGPILHRDRKQAGIYFESCLLLLYVLQSPRESGVRNRIIESPRIIMPSDPPAHSHHDLQRIISHTQSPKILPSALAKSQ